METSRTINIGKMGMRLGTHPSQLSESEYTFSLNSNIEDFNGNGMPMLQVEPSNLLCLDFPVGYSVVGLGRDITEGVTYLFLVNKVTGVSEIGKIDQVVHFNTITDLEKECNCSISYDLEEPLENQTQTPMCNYTTLVKDTCNSCIGFDVNFPIHTVVLKNEKSGKKLYWTDNNKPPRHLNLSNLDTYKYFQDSSCGDDPILNCDVDTDCDDCDDCDECINCEKLNVFPKFKQPCVTIETITNGGNLPQARYWFLIAGSDPYGNELTEYFSFTTPIDLFDSYNNTVTNQTELGKETNLAIKLNIECLDFNFTHYKLVAIQSEALQGNLTYYEDGIYPIENTQVIYASNNNKKRITVEQLYAKKPHWEKTGGMVESNSRLFQYDLTTRPEVNLQPVMILMSAFLRWQTVVAKETLYKDSALDAKFGGYARNENFTWTIDFSTDDGYTTPEYILTHRPATALEKTVVFNGDPDDVDNSKNVRSIVKNLPACDSDRTQFWEYYNSAEALPIDCEASPTIGGQTITVNRSFSCEKLLVTDNTSRTLSFVKPDGYTDLKTFINENKAEFGVGGLYETADSPSNFIDTLFTADYSAENCDLEDILCPNYSNEILESELLFVDNILNEVTTDIEATLAEYVVADAPLTCNVFKSGTSEGYEEDKSAIIDSVLGSGLVVYVRNTPVNNSCSLAIPITSTSGKTGYHLNYLFEADWLDLQTDINATESVVASNRWFTSKLHKNSIWFKGSFGTATKVIIDLTKGTLCEADDALENNETLRYSIFDTCPTTGASPIDDGTYSVPTGQVISLLAGDYPSGEFYIAIDAPIEFGTPTVDPDLYVGSGYVNPPCSCISAGSRPIEYSSTEVEFTSLKLYKSQVWTADCEVVIPEVDDCETKVFSAGKFGYYESNRTYPDNAELFDAQRLTVLAADVPLSIKTEFEQYFVDSTNVDGTYDLNTDTNLACKPIRLYKFPGNDVAPFMYNDTLNDFSESLIFPIGIYINNDLINYFLDLAVVNGLLTQELRNRIKTYRVKRIDRSLQKSIVSKGVLYDTYKYVDENNKDIFYPNYPYNCLGVDSLNKALNGSDIDHPFSSNGNNRYTYHSPETHFNQPPPAIPTEVIYEGTQWGKSIGKFPTVEKHPEYVILGRNAYRLATTIAITEVALETAITLGTAYLEYAKELRTAVITGEQNIPGIAIGAVYVASITAAVFNATHKVGQYRFQWLETFKNLGKPRNFASYYTSKGWYNYMTNERSSENILRGIVASKYLKAGGRYAITEKGETSITHINNEDRESSVFLSFGTNFNWDYSSRYKNYDNFSNKASASRRTAFEAGACDGEEFTSNIASDYVSLRRWLVDQYGDIHTMKFFDTGYCGKLDTDNSCDTIFGGDIRISRLSLKRKIPMFLVNAMGQANGTPFAYSLYNNIGRPKYFIDFDIEISDSVSIANSLFPDIGSEGFYDCADGSPKSKINDFYIKPPHKFYLFYYGIPQFLVESDINLNYRYARREPQEWFFPNGGASDYVWWTQEKNVPIRFDNEYNYNNIFTRNVIYSKNSILPYKYSEESFNRRARMQNGVIGSQPDSTENNFNDPYLNYKPFDFYEFPSKYGKLTALDSMESGKMLARFENQSALLNTIDILAERLNANNSQLGVGIFGQRHIEFAKSEVGYGGSQSKISVECEYGRFWVDAKRGQIFTIQPTGQSQVELSASYLSGKPRDTRQFFKEHLPFKLLRDFPTLNVDNAFNGIGITMGWDAKHRRIFITKKDYVVKDEYKGQVTLVDNVFTVDSAGVELDSMYFEEVSWTIAYNPVVDEFISFYSFSPNYYIPYNNYFQTGYNNTAGSTLWNHLLTNKSYRVFNGKLFPWVLEFPVKDVYQNKISSGVEYWLESQRYHNEYDFSVNNEIGFKKAWVFNSSSGTGTMNLKSSLDVPYFKQVEYPKSNADSTDILATENNKKWNFNSLFNKVSKETANVPQWLVKNIYKEPNPKAFNFKPNNNDRLRGDWFLVRLEEDKESRFHMIFKWLFNKENKDV